ncbi:MAG: hypothetical protein Q9226_003012 [Calogaya cf. arnoldii]
MTPLSGLALGIYGLLIVASAYDVTADLSILQDTTLAKRARICLPGGTKGFTRPLSAFASNLNPNANRPNLYLARAILTWCNTACSCPDDAPDEPQPLPDARAACGTEQDAEAANDAQPTNNNNGAAASANPCPVTTADQSSRKEFDRPVCSAWYGEPILSDCQAAEKSLLDQLHAHWLDAQMVYDEENDLVEIPDYDWPDTTWDDFQNTTPFEINFALASKLTQLMQRYSVAQPYTPKVEFIDPPLTATQGGESEMFVHATKAVIEQCVALQRKGGWISTGDRRPSDNSPWPLAIYVYHPTSRFKQFLDIKYACDVDAEGQPTCHSTDENQPPRKKPKTSDDPTFDDAGQSGSGSVQGTTAPGTSAPGTSAPVAPSAQQCGGRCFHPIDCGGSDCKCGHTRVTPQDGSLGLFACQYLPKLAEDMVGARPVVDFCSHGRCLLTKNTTAENATDDATLAILTRPDAMIPEGVMDCACNCTYVSPACCFPAEGIVWEPPSAKSDVILPAPDDGSCCDATTGKWRNGTVAQGSSAGSNLCSI